MAMNNVEFWEKILIASGMRKDYSGTPEEIIKRAKRINAHRPMPQITDPDVSVRKIDILGFPVLRITQKKKVDKANLFIIGGGMIKAPKPSAVKKAIKVAKESNVDMYIPYYPLCTDYPISTTYKMIHQTYKRMLRKYEPDKISVLGTSAGGNLALGIPAYINYYHLNVPKPGLILAISPESCVHSDLEWELMEVLDKKDIMVPAQFLKDSVEILKHGETDIPAFMFYPQEGDYTGCKKIRFMYGGDETLAACAASFEETMKKYDVDYEINIKDGMFHIYPVYPVVKDAKQGWDEMVKILRDY